MAKGYWIGHVDVTNPEGYKAYLALNGRAFAKYGARFLVRGGAFEAVEGKARARNIVLEFPDYASALACYRSPEYAEALGHRLNNSVGEILVIEGYDGPQPGEA